MDRHSPYACPSRHKRSHDEIEGRSAFRAQYRLPSPRPSPRRTYAAESSSSTSGRATPPLPPERFAGDGLDFRRPANTGWDTMPPAVIDLTNLSDEEEEEEKEEGDETPQVAQHQPQQFIRAAGPPRFPRDVEIVDLSNDSSPFTRPPNEPGTAPAPARSNQESPEVQFVSARPRDPFQNAPRFVLQPRPRMGNHFRGVSIASLDDDDDLDMEFALQGDLQRMQQHMMQRRIPNRTPPRLGALLRTTIFQVPQMNFEAVGFRIGGVPQPPTPPAPVYNAPPPAPEGFTRSPEEDDVIICPNCTDELCTGGNDLKKQVWIVRSCGHIYCGECATNRAASKRKGKAPVSTRAFKECVVEGCGKKVSSKTAMVQLFL